jgi:hypothetical protein
VVARAGLGSRMAVEGSFWGVSAGGSRAAGALVWGSWVKCALAGPMVKMVLRFSTPACQVGTKEGERDSNLARTECWWRKIRRGSSADR